MPVGKLELHCRGASASPRAVDNIKNTHRGDFSYNYATVIFHNKPDATAACKALNGAALLGSEALMVRYATNTRADDMSDDDDDNNDVDDSDAHGSDGMEDDEFDADDFI